MRPLAMSVLAALVAGTCASSQATAGTLGAQFAARYGLATSRIAVLGGGKIQHVIVVVQENRTIDNLFQGFPGADTLPYGMSRGVQKNLIPLPLQYALDPDHSHTGFIADYDNGLLDGFDHRYVNRGCYKMSPQCTAYAFVRSSDSAIYFSLAKQYALADHVMQMNEGPSFANHIHLVAASGGYPIAVAGNETEGLNGPGCMSPGDSTVPGVDLRIAFPGGLLPTPIPACRNLATVLDLVDQQGLTWRYYTPTITDVKNISLDFWTPPYYVKALYANDRPKVVAPETRILDDIRGGALESVSYTAPTIAESDHPHQPAIGEDPQAGPHWVDSIVSAVAASPAYRNNTAILVTWDDWGGWYDHYVPPAQFRYGATANQYGFRTPLLVMSPYVVKAVDHAPRSQASIIRFIESVFGLPSLGALDAKTDDLSGMFNFGQAPIRYHQVGVQIVPARFRGAETTLLHADPDE